MQAPSLSAWLVLGRPQPAPAPVEAPTDTAFSDALAAELDHEPGAQASAEATPVPTGGAPAPLPAVASLLAGAGQAPVPLQAGASGAQQGIFGFGRAALNNPAERARMAMVLASLPATASPGASSWSSAIQPASRLPENHFKELLHGLAVEFGISETFITAVMFAESGGNPNAVGDNGHSVGLFQLHDRGLGHGLGDRRYDPELNARIGVGGLATGWREGISRGLGGEELVRFAYDYRFNPGGGWRVQGDRVVAYWKALELQASPASFASSAFAPRSLEWPVSGGRVTQESHDGHVAVDIGVVTGTPIRSVAAGTVVAVERLETGYGWHVIVDHGNGWQTLYAHASEIMVNPGDRVAPGQTLALSGNTGKSTGPHLHFEIRYQGERVNPLTYLR